MNNLNIENLFSTPVAFFKYDKSFTKKQEDFLLKQERLPNEGNTTSKDRKILHNSKLKDLSSFIQVSVDQYFDEVYKPKYDVSLYITQSWLNYSEPGQYHHKHTHPNSLVSGVFYVNAKPEFDKIYFSNEPYQQLKVESREFNRWNSSTWWFPIETSLLVLFPSSLPHFVETVSSDETRISIAFNTFLKGYLGNDDRLTGLHL